MKRFIAVLAATMLIFGAVTASAADISISINGEAFTPKNALGQEVEPFIDNGSTFLPVRAISEAVEKEVSYDAENNAVYIGTLPTKEAVSEIPSLKVGDRIFYESDTSKGFDTDTYVQIDRYIRLAESLFSEEDIALAAEEVRADTEDWMQNGVSESIILASYPLGTLDRMYYLEACMKLLEGYAVGEPEESYYENYVTVKHILVETEDEAEEILSKLAEGRSFDELIVEYNTDPGQTKDSSYTFTYSYMVEEFEKAAFSLEEGAYTTEPVKSQFGYHIIERLPLDKEAVSTYEFYYGKINEMLPAERAVTEVGRDDEYYGEIEGVKISKNILTLITGSENYRQEAFNFLISWQAMYSTCIENGFVSEFELAAAQAAYDMSYEEFIEEAGVEITEEEYEFYSKFIVLYTALENADVDDDVLYAAYEECLSKVNYEIYRDIRVFVDGNVIVPTDVNNAYVAPKNVDGTVYVPVRAIVEALGMSADWDNDTRTVVITK